MDEENIRDPDQPFYDRLIDPPSVPDYEEEYEQAIQQSRIEYETLQKHILYELQEKEREERLHKFDGIKKICRRLIAVCEKDRPALELFLYFISLYETDYINQFDAEPEFYYNLFSILETTRISKGDLELCRKLIVLKNI